jgi:uncharacterized membrane protein
MKIQKLSRHVLIGTILVVFLLVVTAAVVSCYFFLWEHGGDDDVGQLLTTETPNDLIDDDPTETTVDKEIETMNTKAAGGTILWSQVTVADEPMSTPAIADCNGDGDLEVIVASAGDAIYAFNPDGTEFWDHPYTDDMIEYLGIDGYDGMDFEPPPIFSSVTVADIDMGSDPEIIVGVKDGALCLRANGDLHWKKGKTTGYYFSTCGITDLEGEWTGVKDDLEVIMASDDASRNGWLEAFMVDGGDIFREEVTCGFEGGLIGCSIATKDLDGSFEDEREPEPDVEETDTELIVGNHDYGMRVYKRAGNQANGKPNYDEKFNDMLAGHQTYATPAVGNFSGDMECEIITGSCEGGQITWEGWGGKLYCYNRAGDLLWDFSTGSSRAGIISSPSVADVHCAKNDPDEKELDYEVFFGCDNGKFYSLNAEYHSELWSYDTGGRVMSSPAICNIDSDDELEVIIGSDSGKVYCFDGDPSDGDDDGQSIPGDGSSHDLLWVADIGNPVGISSPVVGDINLDGVLEVIIGDTKGYVHCISAGGRCVRGQNDWPMFHYDLNKTGYYNPQTSFGVDLYPRRDLSGYPDPMIKMVEPGKSVSFNITVKNTGKAYGAQAMDLVYLKVDGTPPGWSTFLDTPPDLGNPNPDYVRLMVDQTTNITLWVHAPWEGEIGDLAVINVTGNSSNDPWAYDTLTTITMLNVAIDFDCEFTLQEDTDPKSKYEGYTWDKISPGEEAVYAFVIRNLGNCNDTYKVKISGVPQGWTAYFLDSGTDTTYVTLMSSIFEEMYNDDVQTTLYVKVICPPDATLDEEAWMKLTVTSVKSNETGEGGIDVIVKWKELLLVAGHLTDLSLTCNEPTKFIDPGGTVDFEVIVENLSNDEITVEYEYDGLLHDWRCSDLEPTPLLIGQKIKKLVTLTAPEDAPADLTCVMTISGKIQGSTHLRSSVGITAIVRHIYDFEVTVDPEKISVDPGDEVILDISVQNLGNGKDVIMPSPFDVNLGWNVSFMLQGFRVTSIDLYYRGWANFSVVMKIPSDTIANQYKVGLNFSDLEKTVIKYIKIKVNQTFDLRVHPYPYDKFAENPQKTEGYLDPGRIVPFLVEVQNKANGPDLVNLSLEGLDDNWAGWFGAVANTPDFTRNVKYIDYDEMVIISNMGADINYLPNSSTSKRISIYLPTEQTAWLTAYIQAPMDALEDDRRTISIKGESSGGSKDDQSNNKASMDITILYADLMIDGLIHVTASDSDLTAGDLSTISVNIRNVGDIEAVNVVVALKIDGKEIKRAVVKRVLVDKDQLVTFSWKVEGGKHKVTIEIDPDNTIVETNDQTVGINNNVKSRDVKPPWAPERILGSAVATFLLPLFLLLLVIAAIGIATMIYLKRKQQKE